MVQLIDTLSLRGAEIRYSDSKADGPAVVLSHGAGMDHSAFEHQAAALGAAGYRTVLWDQRGHGASTLAPGARFTAADTLADLAALMDALRLDRPVLVGHSLGGNLSQEYVRRHPERASGLIVIGSTWNAGPLGSVERVGLRVAAPMLRLIPAGRLPGLMARASAITPDAIRQTEAMFASMPKHVFLDVWRATVSFVAPDATRRTAVPLGLIRGAEDRTGNIATAMPRWAHAEGVTEQVIPDAGHVVTLDAPEAASQALLRLLERWHPDHPAAGGDDG